jgi:poly(A) polymerase
VIYSAVKYGILPHQINKNALAVLTQLTKAGYEAYLVGGCVRDLLLGREPKDFDIATNAHPEQVKAVFRNCRLIGRRFRLAHVFYGREILEVATFRTSSETENNNQKTHEDGRLLRDNSYGTIAEDVWRRDFTVNALYFNAKDSSVIDYTGGMQACQEGVLKLIGNPETRYREDPVRMLRAIRFVGKLNFTLHPDTERPIAELAHLLTAIPNARLYDEVLKLFFSGSALNTFEQLRQYGLFKFLFPQTESYLIEETEGTMLEFLIKALENSDQRVAMGKSITPYFLLSVFLWGAVQNKVKEKQAQGENAYHAMQYSAYDVLKLQVKTTSIPRRVTQSMREVWALQANFEQRTYSKVYRLLAHPRFRAAYDFLLLRAEIGYASAILAQWWTVFQDVPSKEQEKMLVCLNSTKTQRKYRRRASKKTHD